MHRVRRQVAVEAEEGDVARSERLESPGVGLGVVDHLSVQAPVLVVRRPLDDLPLVVVRRRGARPGNPEIDAELVLALAGDDFNGRIEALGEDVGVQVDRLLVPGVAIPEVPLEERQVRGSQSLECELLGHQVAERALSISSPRPWRAREAQRSQFGGRPGSLCRRTGSRQERTGGEPLGGPTRSGPEHCRSECGCSRLSLGVP